MGKLRTRRDMISLRKPGQCWAFRICSFSNASSYEAVTITPSSGMGEGCLEKSLYKAELRLPDPHVCHAKVHGPWGLSVGGGS